MAVVDHQRASMAVAALPALVLWVVVFNLGVLQVSSFNLGSIPGIGFGTNSIPGVSNVGSMLGIGQCDLHLGNIFKCNEEVKNFNGAASPPQSSPQQSPTAADELTSPPPGSLPESDSPSLAPAESPADGFPWSSPPMVLPVSPAPSSDGEEAADQTKEEGGMSVLGSARNHLVADKSSDSSNSTECCRAVLHVNLSCLCSFLSLKMVMALQLAEGYLGKVATMCHLDFKGC